MKSMLARLALASASLLTIYGCGGGSVGGGTSTTDITTSEIPSLPLTALTQPAASNCFALRSGAYNFISPDTSGILANQVGRVTIDAVALTVTASSGTSPLTATSESCHYTGNNGNNDIVVSQAGIIVMRRGNSTSNGLDIGLPDQAYTVADLAGTWNMLGLNSSNLGTYTGTASSVTINSAGTETALNICQNDATWDVTNCVDETTGLLSLSANSAGGFDLIDETNGVKGRVFAYKAGNGDMAGIQVNAGGTFNVFTKQRTNGLPTVGLVTTYWNLSMNNLLISDRPVDENSNTIVSVDSAVQSFVRSQKTVGGNDAHPETLFVNNPRKGYAFRPAGAALIADGSRVTFAEFTSLNLRGMGLTVLLLPAQKRFVFSVVQP